MHHQRPNTKEERDQRDEERAAKLELLHGRLVDQVAALTSGDEWQRMLRMAARMRQYSLNNVLLILAQRPDATQVAGYRAWQALGYQVRRGETGISILAPMTYRVRDDKDDDERRLLRLAGFRVATVFDISQCDGAPVPDVRPIQLEGDAPQDMWDDVTDRIREAGYQVRRGACATAGANGETDPRTKVVTVRTDLPPAQACKTAAHELAHIHLGHVDDIGEYRLHRGRMEVEAESVAFLIAAEYGLDAAGYSVGYTAHWANGDVQVIRETAERVITAARALTSAEPIDEVA
jgi:antirestriction protein ArdC